MKHIAVLGANGRLAHEVMQAFHAADYQVTAISRSTQVRQAPAGVKRITADAMNLRQLKKAVRGADFVFNGINPPYTDWVHRALPLARNVMDAVRSTGAVHLFPGNLYNYGKTIPEVCTLHTPAVADGMKARIRIEMERLFAAAAEKYRIQTLLIRAGDGYGGSGRGLWFEQTLVDKLAQGQFVYPGPMDVAHAWAYLPDLARTFVTIAEQYQQCQAFEQVLYPGHNLTGAEFKNLVEQACGRELILIPVPWKLIKFGSLLVPMWREMQETSYLWSRPHRLCGERLMQLSGVLLSTPPEDAVRQALLASGKI